jgi:FkbM family methyltransferase
MNPSLVYRLKGFHTFFTNSNERKFFWMSLRYGSRKRFSPVQINFLQFKFELPDALSFIWQFKEIFVEEYYRFETNSKIPVIYDCGANVGTSCAFFKFFYPHSKIVAFEPNPNISEYLMKNIAANSFKNIEVVKKAVWINNDGLALGLEDADGSSMHIENNITQVESVRLKNYIDEEETIDMLKMDIEGAEVEVLMDCKNSLRNVKNIFVEFHSYKNNPQKLSALLAVLEESGFRYFILQPENRSKPFLNRSNKSNPGMDLQINIFAFRV